MMSELDQVSQDVNNDAQPPQEVELKLVAQHDALGQFKAHVLPMFDGSVVESAATLRNQYFDTPEQQLREWKMGLRIRSRDGQHEQTLKHKGSVVGGLHSRPEFNVNVPTSNLDLSAFPEEAFPTGVELTQLQDDLHPLFSTHFHRTTFLLTDANDNQFEVVFDIGEVASDNDQRAINEIELELVKGSPLALFEVAQLIVEHCSARVNDLTKAAIGYMLCNGQPFKNKKLPYVLPLQRSESTEDAFLLAINSGLAHWQYHQSVYCESFRLSALTEIVRAVRLVLQAFSLYLPVLQCKEMLDIHRMLVNFVQRWEWQDEVQSIRYLRSRRGPFSKRLNRDQSLMSYLQGRKLGILNMHDPQAIIFSTESTQLQLKVAALQFAKPWRQVTKAYDAPVMEHAQGWLSQGWQAVLQAMPGKNLSASQYLAAAVVLRQILRHGFMLAGLFGEERETFRAPWLDLALGLEELNALTLLDEVLQQTDLDDKHELQSWTRNKTDALLTVMERTRHVAVNTDIYW